MERNELNLSSLILGVLLCVAVVGGVSYILSLRSENAQLARVGPTAATVAPTARTLNPERRAAMLAILRSAARDSERAVWFATTPNNPEAAAFQSVLQSVFEEAGWQVRANAPVTFPVKPGIFVFMADEEPPPYALRAAEALDATGTAVTGGRGYRAFYQQKKQEDPNWRGFEMAPEQSYVVVIGRQPEP